MPCDCCALGFAETFGDRVVRHEAKRFRRKGLAARSKKLLAAVEGAITLKGASALEVGAGVGGLAITLVQRGVGRATIIDAVPAYVDAARALAGEYGVDEALDIHVGDYSDPSLEREPVDLVIMDRVVCCYPVWEELLDPAARQAGRAIALTYPRESWWTRLGLSAINAVQRLRRLAFRVHLHPPAEIHRLLEGQGFGVRVAGHHGPWEIAVATRA